MVIEADHQFAGLWRVIRRRPLARVVLMLLLVALGFYAAPARAQSAVTVVPDQPRISLARHIRVFEDHTRRASFEEVLRARFTEPKLVTDTWAHLGRSDAIVWVRFRLKNPANQKVQVGLQPTAPFVDRIELYEAGRGLVSRTGDSIPRRQRTHGGVTPRFDIELPARHEADFYLRIDTSGNILLPLTLEETHALEDDIGSRQRWIGGVLALLLAAAAFFFLTFLTSRRRAFILYSLHLLTSAAFVAAVEGHLQLLLPVQHAYWTFAIVLLTDLTGLLFLRAFLDTRRTRPKLDRAFVLMGSVIATCALWVLVAGEHFNGQTLVHILGSGIAVVQAATAIYEGLHGPRSRQLYAFSWLVYFATRFVSSLGVAGFAALEGTDPLELMMASYFLEAMLTGLALVAKIREDQLALAESERRLADLIRESPDGIVLLLEGKCVSVNPAAEQVLAQAEDALKGKSFSDLGFSEDCRAQLGDAFDDALGGRVGATRAVAVLPHGGEARYVDANFRKFAGEGGEALVQMTLRDVTERVAAERTSRLAEVRAQKAERLEAIGRLAGGVAHDFNNILTVILGNAELLKMDAPSEEAQQIIQAAQTAKGLTTQLLTFSKRDTVAGASADLRQVIQDSQSLLKPLLSEKIELRVELDEELPRVRGDAGQLQQVLMNLCLNARDAMPDGGTVTLRASTTSKSDDQPRVSLSVADTGMGMDEDTQQRAFEPFFSTKPKGRGTGLGLATVFGVVHASGGEIHLTSSPGRGTQVEVELPMAEDQTSAERSPSAPPSAGAAGTLLLVEDETDVLNVTRKVLESAGHEVMAANSPDEALALAASSNARIDCIITDVVMPGMDGPALAKRLTEMLGPVPVLYVSGYMPEQVGHDLELEVNCLRKPVKASILLGRVANLLEPQPSGGTSAA